jgi:hypothetical protein
MRESADTSTRRVAGRLFGALKRVPARVLRRGGGGRGGSDAATSTSGTSPLASLSGSAVAYVPPLPPPLPPPSLSPLETAAAALSAVASALSPWLGGGGTPDIASLLPPGLSAEDVAWRAGACFPSRIAAAATAGGDGGEEGVGAARSTPAHHHHNHHHHHLAAVGTRAFTLLGASLRIYDFGVYVSPDAVAASPALDPAHAAADPAAFARRLRSCDAVGKTLLVRTRRALPLPLMKAEYDRILTRRIALVGGDPSDAALAELLGLFRQEVLPPSARGPAGMVRGGTVLEFTRSPGGRLAVSLDGVLLARVTSEPLASAVFDIYLGADLPCCAASQAAAHRRVAAWAAGESGQRLGPAWRETVEAVEAEHEPGPLAPELVCGRFREGGKCGGRRRKTRN